jgi:hypothetical protein
MQTQPIENIDAVLGRFQAWAGASNASETKPGIRELSYDEALRSRRYRWKAADDKPAKKKLAAEPDVPPKLQPGRLKAAPTKLRETKRKPATQARSGNHAAKAASAAKTDAKPAFRDVLAQTVRPPEVVLAAQPLELSRQVAISIRLAPAERALIKTRAAEAGISASTYIRQCALEVEQLRAQVQQALAAMERKSMVASAAPASVHTPGFFARLARRFFPGSAPALALRA